jgi:alginate O-acetyltransferase complex protein AlgI
VFFHSLAFAIFLPVVLLVYYQLGWRKQNVWLLAASYLFYGWWDWRFLGLIAISTIIDYVAGLKIHAAGDDQRRRKQWLWVSMVANLGILGFFKYCDFFVESAGAALASIGFDPHLPTLKIILPPGISFYTFQTMSYTIDIYRRQMEPHRNFLSFALFVAYFPQLVAGPIERASRLLPQIDRPRPRVRRQAIASGCALILTGLFKKMAIADTIGPLSDIAFDAENARIASTATLVAGVYAFALQIYCDFSAYSDIARGSSRLLGIELMENFEAPYLARNITDFWRRWHISLSTWLRDYLYIPLGGNRGGSFQTYRNLMLTMFLGGLWHGAAWPFVAWGVLHGLYLAAHKWWKGDAPRVAPLATARDWAVAIFWTVVTFHLVCLTWIFFRAGAKGFDLAWDVLCGIASFRGPFDFAPNVLWAMGLTLLLDIAQRSYREHAWALRLPSFARALVILLMLGGVMLAVLAGGDSRAFIYFQF